MSDVLLYSIEVFNLFLAVYENIPVSFVLSTAHRTCTVRCISHSLLLVTSQYCQYPFFLLTGLLVQQYLSFTAIQLASLFVRHFVGRNMCKALERNVLFGRNTTIIRRRRGSISTRLGLPSSLCPLWTPSRHLQPRHWHSRVQPSVEQTSPGVPPLRP